MGFGVGSGPLLAEDISLAADASLPANLVKVVLVVSPVGLKYSIETLDSFILLTETETSFSHLSLPKVIFSM
jgi:hypothetical protein